METPGEWVKVGLGMFQAEETESAKTWRWGQPGVFSEQQGGQCGCSWSVRGIVVGKGGREIKVGVGINMVVEHQGSCTSKQRFSLAFVLKELGAYWGF